MPSAVPTTRTGPILLAAFVAFVLSVTASLPVAALLGFHRGTDRTPVDFFVTTVAQDITLLLVLPALLRRWADGAPAVLEGHRRIDIRLGLGAGVGIWLLLTTAGFLQARIIGPHPQAVTLIEQAHPSALNLVFELVVASGLVPIAEELLFRAVLFAAFRQRMGFWPAAIISSLLFGLAHGLTAIVPIAISGICFAALYERRRSLGTNALAHGTVNLISTVIVYLTAASRVG